MPATSFIFYPVREKVSDRRAMKDVENGKDGVKDNDLVDEGLVGNVEDVIKQKKIYNTRDGIKHFS